MAFSGGAARETHLRRAVTQGKRGRCDSTTDCRLPHSWVVFQFENGHLAIDGCERILSADKAPGPLTTALDSENLPDTRQPREHRATPSRQSDNFVPVGFRSDDLAASTGPKCAECQHGAIIGPVHRRSCAIRDT